MGRTGLTWRLCVLVALVAFGWWFPLSASFATSGKFDDGNGEGETVDKIDITTFSHDDSPTTITYAVEFLNAWEHDDLTAIVWTLDFSPDSGGADEDGCIKVLPGSSSAPELTAVFLDDCVDSIADDLEVVHETNTDELTVTYPNAILKEANDDKAVKEYAYRIVATDGDGGDAQSNDFAPDATADRAEHRFAAAGGGGPSSSPKPIPTPPSDDETQEESDDEGSASDDEEESDADSGADDVEVLSASAGRAQLPDTGPTSDPSTSRTVLFAAGGSLLAAGSLLRWAARRARP